MKTATLADVESRFQYYVKASQDGPVVVTRNRKPVVVLFAVSDKDDLERLLMAHSPQLQAILDDSRRSIAAGDGIPSERFWRELASEQAARKRPRKRRKPAK